MEKNKPKYSLKIKILGSLVGVLGICTFVGIILMIGLAIAEWRVQNVDKAHVVVIAENLANPQIKQTSPPRPSQKATNDAISPDIRTDWPSGSDRFVHLQSNFTLDNPVVNDHLPTRNPSIYSYVGSATVDCMETISGEQIGCDTVAKKLPILLPDEVFKYYCRDGVCMEPGNCTYIVGADPFWYDPKYMVEDVEAVRMEYYPKMETLCKVP